MMTGTRDGSARLFLYDGEYDFRLTIRLLEQLQEKCNAGPLKILRRLLDGEYMIGDVVHVLRLGLIGGGMDPAKAYNFVMDRIGTYVECTPDVADEDMRLSPRFVAAAILSNALVGPEDEQVGKEGGEKVTCGPSPRSTKQAAQWGSHQGRSET